MAVQVADGFLMGRNSRLVCLGDSITEDARGYVPLMSALIAAGYPERNVSVVNAGIGGHRAPDMLERFKRDVLERRPAVVTISVGINDVWHGFTDTSPDGSGPRGVQLDTYTLCVRQMLAMLRESTDAEPVLITPTVIGEDIDNPDNARNARLRGYVEAIRSLADEHGTYLADAHGAFLQAIRAGVASNPAFRLTTDGVHTNDSGAAVLALCLLGALGFAGLAG
ncbi:MAG: SGNH/GDSL hydrolase family protein [Armatimonadetes bacterium]|nr:SGNH/GDSL hydrolase family protein [Armatimonadota bacterium]MDE2207851.1 SGNH/GDSL hydrolase family protein [Armatimonadota bacterium]